MTQLQTQPNLGPEASGRTGLCGTHFRFENHPAKLSRMTVILCYAFIYQLTTLMLNVGEMSRKMD